MVLCAPFPAPRGTQAYVAELAEGLIARGHEVHLWCYAGSLGGQPPEGLILHRASALPGVPTSVGSGPSPARPANDALVLARLMAELPTLGPILLHGHNHEGGLAAGIAGRALGLPVLYHVHSALAEELPAWARLGRGLLSSVGGLLDAGVPLLADRVLTLDAPSADALSQRLGRPAHPVPPGVSAWSGVPAPLPGPGPWVAYAGNLDPYQDLPLLLGAIRRTRRLHPRARLLLVTHDPPGQARLLAARYGLDPRALFVLSPTGPEDAQRFLAAADMSVVPRTGRGGYPIKLLNSLGAGVPVVASHPASKGLAEASGVVPTSPTAEGLARGICRLIESPAQRAALSAAALSFARAHPWSQVAAAAEAHYDVLARVAFGQGRERGLPGIKP